MNCICGNILNRGQIKFCSRDCFYQSGIAHKGKSHSKETKETLRDNALNNPRVMATTFQSGHDFWDHPKVKRNWFKKGHKPVNWLGGQRSPSQVIKDDPRYIEWRRLVFNRDNYTCVLCYAKNCALNADHIYSKYKYPDKAFDVSNGRTLCISCHQKTPNYGGKAIKYENLCS